MDKSKSTMAQQVALAASAYQQQRTGHMPESVTVVLSEDTLVVTLHGALSPAEKVLAANLSRDDQGRSNSESPDHGPDCTPG